MNSVYLCPIKTYKEDGNGMYFYDILSTFHLNKSLNPRGYYSRTRFSCLYDSHDISQIHTIYKNFYDFFSTISFLISIDLTICHGAIDKRMEKILVMVKLNNNLTRYLKLKILKFKYMICPLLLDIFQNYFPKMNVSFLLS